MNANEVIAGRANEILTGHARRQDPGPSQRPLSTRASRPTTAFPTAMHVAAGAAVHRRLLPALS
jgi:fumarate hydratase class II